MRLDVLLKSRLGQGHGVDAVGHHLLHRLGVVLLIAYGFLLAVPALEDHPFAVFVELPFFHIFGHVHGICTQNIYDIYGGVVALQVEHRHVKVDP